MNKTQTRLEHVLERHRPAQTAQGRGRGASAPWRRVVSGDRAADEGPLYAFLAADRPVRLCLHGAPTGFWKKRGIDVDISRGFGSMGAINGVVGDKFEMGEAATGAICLV